MRLHFPSLLIGTLSAICFAALLAADYANQEAGRFQLEASSNHVFVLDRHTGRVWQKFVTDGAGQSDQDFALPKIR